MVYNKHYHRFTSTKDKCFCPPGFTSEYHVSGIVK